MKKSYVNTLINDKAKFERLNKMPYYVFLLQRYPIWDVPRNAFINHIKDQLNQSNK